MNIKILSRKKVKELFNENNEILSCVNIISIRDFGQSKVFDDCRDVLNLCFDDVLNGDSHCFTKVQAKEIHDFVMRTLEQGKDLIVHCNGGVSRSAGCVAAISLGLVKKGILVAPTSEEIWTNSRYFPNEFVFKLIANEFSANISDEEINVLIKKNIDAISTD